MHRRQSLDQRQGIEANSVAVHEWVGQDIHRVDPTLESRERGREILGSPDFERGDVEAEGLGRCLNLADLQDGGWRLTIMANRGSPGTPSRNRASRLPARSVDCSDRPVTLPPGRARVATKPVPTGSAANAMTIGMTDVAFFAAITGSAECVTITSTLR